MFVFSTTNVMEKTNMVKCYLAVHLAFAAALAIAARFAFDNFAARAFPPLLPSSAAALRGAGASSTSPVAICMTRTALPITSAGRF